MALYLPSVVDFDTNCVVVLDNYRARVYEEQPTNINTSYNYTDYALDNHYIEFYGVETFTSSDSLPSCYPSSNLTHSAIDRTDISDIVITTMFIFGITFWIFMKLLHYLFKGWGWF